MKRFLAAAAIFCLCGSLFAYNGVTSVDRGPENTVLKQVVQTDSSSLVYGTFTLPQTYEGFVFLNISRKIHVCAGDEDYKLIHSYNMPVADESWMECILLEKAGQSLNFVLEFEKFPVDAPFDIVDGGTGGKPFEFIGVKTAAVDDAKAAGVKRFTSSTPAVSCGQYYDEGHCYTFYKRDGVFVSSCFTYGETNFTIYLTIVNDSDHGILFNTDKISVTGHRPKGKKTEEVSLPLFSKSEYVSLVASNDAIKAERETQSRGLQELGTAVSFARIGTPFRSAEYTGLSVLGGLIHDVGQNAMRPILNELDKTRAERTKNYLLSQSIKSGESISGILRISRPKKVNDFEFSMLMDGYEFVFADSVGN